MRYPGICVVLVLLAIFGSFGCSGDSTTTGIPVYNLPGNMGGDQQEEPTGPRLNAIIIDPAAVNIELGGKQIFNAYGHYSDGAVINITGSVTWYSSNTNVGNVSDKGVFSASGEGYAGVGAYMKSFNVESTDTYVYSAYSFANVFPAGTKPPEPVRNVHATQIGNKVVISWTFSNETDIKGYNVYRTRTSGVGYDKDTPLNADLIERLNYYEDLNPGGGIVYYVVAAVNEDDEIGAFSSEVEFDFNPEPPWEDM